MRCKPHGIVLAYYSLALGLNSLRALSKPRQVLIMPEKIVFVSGCYDVLHGGHVEFFEQARSLGDRLVVCFAGDESLRRHKRPQPSIPTIHKLHLLSALRPVDEVVIGDDLEAPHGLDFKKAFLSIRPQILAVTEDDKCVPAAAPSAACSMLLSRTLCCQPAWHWPVSGSSRLCDAMASKHPTCSPPACATCLHSTSYACLGALPRYGDVKRELCAEVGAEYVVLPKSLQYEKTSTTDILRRIKAPVWAPLRQDHSQAGWLEQGEPGLASGQGSTGHRQSQDS
ncbi:cytidyltransferase [Haematococcus lacustris]|uniref:Cytidyltransferase n=1 Tax=Haematococcus lacustris TaxID=44745 RepID=A0A699YYM6_HAELA|nr:cytidyltransferase [Haematococcus lacustris]